MANRYWVGGTATWDGTALLKWSTTSGGLGGSAVPTSADNVFFDAASGANTVTIGAGTAVCNQLTMTGFTGTIAFGTNKITIAGGGTIYTGATTFSVTGTPLIDCTLAGSTGRTISPSATTEANSISFNISAGTGLVTINLAVKNLNFTGFSGTFANSTKTIYGNLTLVSGMTLNAGGSTTTFAATSGTQTITSATLTQDYAITFAGTATYQLADALTSGSTRTMTLTSGTLDLNDKTLTTGLFSSSNSNTRSILFGTTGNITCSGTGTVWTTSTITNFSLTGTPTVNLTNTSSTLRGITQGAGTAAQAVNFYIKAGTGQVSLFTTSGAFRDIDFTGSTAILGVGSSINCFGNIVLTNDTTASGFSVTFAGTSGTQTMTSNGKTFDCALSINGVGGTVQLVDALTMGSSRTLTLTNGTFNSNAKSVTVGAFSAANNNTKTFTITNSTFTVLSGTTTTGFIFQTPGTTFNVTGSNIVFTTSGNTVYYGGTTAAVTYPQVTMSGTGILNIGFGQSTSSITTLTNTVQPCTISISTTSLLTVTNFNLSGTTGNLVTFNSNTAGTARTISQASGTVNALYLNVKDSTATGGAKWYANSSNDLGNNTGWNIFNNSFLAVF